MIECLRKVLFVLVGENLIRLSKLFLLLIKKKSVNLEIEDYDLEN